MKKYSILLLLILITSPIFSQSTKTFSLQQCLQSALDNHPLNNKADQLNQSLKIQNELIQVSTLPEISWNGTAKIQSESVGIEFDNPNIPSIDIPLYSAQTSLDLKYMIYDGGMKKSQKVINKAGIDVQLAQLASDKNSIKKEVVSLYLGVLMTMEKEKVLQNANNRIQDNLKQLEHAMEFGVIQKNDKKHLEVKVAELKAQMYENKANQQALIQSLSQLCELELNGEDHFKSPELNDFEINDLVDRPELEVFKAEKKKLDALSVQADVKKKAKVFVFGTAGTGYPNPLNFFNDEISLYGIAGIGFSWNFFDWGKTKHEKQLLKVQQDMLETHEQNILTSLNRYNEKYRIEINKYNELISLENELLVLREEIATLQKTKLEQGVILPTEYLGTINDIIDSQLKIDRYKLEQIKLKIEYKLLKGTL